MLAHFYPGALTERICAGDQVAARSPQRIDLIHSAFAAPVVEVNRLWRFWRTPASSQRSRGTSRCTLDTSAKMVINN